MSQTDLKIENIFRSAETQLGLLLGWGNILFCNFMAAALGPLARPSRSARPRNELNLT